MLPATISKEIRDQVRHYLEATFEFRDEQIQKQLDVFLNNPRTGIFKGPWIQLRRPYRPAPDGWISPLEFGLSFHPFLHQAESWSRLNSNNHEPESTLVTTGTGSGKTECFLYPLLDHVLRSRKSGQRGIKAIVLYPMNALASDQEKRFAESIFRIDALQKANIRVGIYTGRHDPSQAGTSKGSGSKTMGKEWGISNHEVLQEDPPDILLTNYKMLDYLLMRPQDQRLWRYNEKGTLKYLVLDELHTYDGAQGSDVACLIRRLKERLDISKGELCAVGTSATIESDTETSSIIQDVSQEAVTDGKQLLAQFASTLFEESIEPEAVIGENRLEVNEIAPIENIIDRTGEYPSPESCAHTEEEDLELYAQKVSAAWQAPIQADFSTENNPEESWRIALAEWLKTHSLFRTLLEIFAQAEKEKKDPVDWNELLLQAASKDWDLRNIDGLENKETVLASFVALVNQAKAIPKGSSRAFPFVPTQMQLWMRELRRIGRNVSPNAGFGWLDEPVGGMHVLPSFYCAKCGESGWVSSISTVDDTNIQNSCGPDAHKLKDQSQDIYVDWFKGKNYHDPDTVLISPWIDADEEVSDGPTQESLGYHHWHLHPDSLVIAKHDGSQKCPLTGKKDGIRVKVNMEQGPKSNDNPEIVGKQKCPHCGEYHMVGFVGRRAATLSAVAIDEMFTSTLNNDAKLLAFTDSVQDASHRAGFFTARTWRYTFRTALQYVIDEAGDEGIPLASVAERLINYWSKTGTGRPGSVKETMAVLMPSDLIELPAWINFRDDTVEKPDADLINKFQARINWEATAEYGHLMQAGPSLERMGCSALAWDEDIIHKTISLLKDKLPGIDPLFESISEAQLRVWLYGVLYRYRTHGAIFHDYVSDLAEKTFWGKFPRGMSIPNREMYPPAVQGTQPKLISTSKNTSSNPHEHILATDEKSWIITWGKRSLEILTTNSLVDIASALLDVGVESGLLKELHSTSENKRTYAINTHAIRLTNDVVRLDYGYGEKPLIRPKTEAEYWKQAPCLEYRKKDTHYKIGAWKRRQLYYQSRYRKGALRRVIATEHTGMLNTRLREKTQTTFAKAPEDKHHDDPNVLTCTSTLEMGIDIGDLSSTMLCSIPPSTASYLQRIGRAGRSTGTALILSMINQKPHDLFFYGRPHEILKGKVESPGCWLDAPSVLARQYLAFAIDTAVKREKLNSLPKSAINLIEDIANDEGQIPHLFTWLNSEEEEIQSLFKERFSNDNTLHQDTLERFQDETRTDVLRERTYKACVDFKTEHRSVLNARERLKKEIEKLSGNTENEQAIKDVEQEMRLLTQRQRSLGQKTSLELLTDNGLLPNYAFPERGVRFYGSIYDKYQRDERKQDVTLDITRSAGGAIRELAPHNTFYTHSKRFDIQQIAIGNDETPLVENWAICGDCGHMRKTIDIDEQSNPGCPQCGSNNGTRSQLNIGQQKNFLEFSRSSALSFMEHFDSLSGDQKDDRDQRRYNLHTTFDHTIEAPSGAVGEDTLPFGIEFRSAMVMREINTGYEGMNGSVYFNDHTRVSDTGFRVCESCGIVAGPLGMPDANEHRRNCSFRKTFQDNLQRGITSDPFKWKDTYLYRELKSEAIRLLLPYTDPADIETLKACLMLGLKKRFQGNPAHLLTEEQMLPQQDEIGNRHYLVLMDAVPGGTGYLKALFEEEKNGVAGNGIVTCLKLARNELTQCRCRGYKDEDEDPDGCYRCIRSYAHQYNADLISRERGIQLLNELIAAAEKMQTKEHLNDIESQSLYDSVLEKHFAEALEKFVKQKGGFWEDTIIKGEKGHRFRLPTSTHMWTVQMQYDMDKSNDVYVQSVPDFLISCEDENIKPIAVFTDGFKYHCWPHNNQLPDIQKRRSIIDSGNFYVWNITWDDLKGALKDQPLVLNPKVHDHIKTFAKKLKINMHTLPSFKEVISGGFTQLTAFIENPNSDSWKTLAHLITFVQVARNGLAHSLTLQDMQTKIDSWRGDKNSLQIETSEGDWHASEQISTTGDFVGLVENVSLHTGGFNDVSVQCRLLDTDELVTEDGFDIRWRKNLASFNLYQFCERFQLCALSEGQEGTAPLIQIQSPEDLPDDWQAVVDNAVNQVENLLLALHDHGAALPENEYYHEQIGDNYFAELSWPHAKNPCVLLLAQQIESAPYWQKLGYTVYAYEKLHGIDVESLATQMVAGMKG